MAEPLYPPEMTKDNRDAQGGRVEDVEGPTTAKSRYTATLGRGIEVLFLVAARGPLSTREIGEIFGWNRSTTYRLVQTLAYYRLIRRNSDTNTYSLAPRLWELGVSAFGPSEVRISAGRVIRDLANQYGETVHLGVYDFGEVIYIDKADGWHPIGSYTKLGGRAPAYCVATGKALLAHQTDSEINCRVEGALHRFTSLTLCDAEELRNELRNVRRSGYAVNRGEWREGVGGLAVPIFDEIEDVPFALGFSGPSKRINQRSEELLEALREAVPRLLTGAAL